MEEEICVKLRLGYLILDLLKEKQKRELYDHCIYYTKDEIIELIKENLDSALSLLEMQEKEVVKRVKVGNYCAWRIKE